jgi:competence protein ComEC
MRWFEKKPALLAAIAFVLGIVAAYYSNWPTTWLLGGLFISLIFSIVFFVRSLLSLSSAFLILALFFVGATHINIRTQGLSPNSINEFNDFPFSVAVEGVICKPIENRGEGQSTVIAVDSVWILSSAYAACGQCLLRIFQPVADLSYGTRIVMRGQLRSPPGERNPGEFDYQKYLAAQKINAILSVASGERILFLKRHEGAPLLQLVVYPARRFIINFIDSTLAGQQAALLKALLIGARGEIDSDLRESFANVGVIHVLAVSGLHVGFILIGLIGFLSFFRVPNPWRTLMTILGLIFYAWLTGLSPSVTRATIMAIVIVTGRLLQRKSDVLNSLAVAVLVILAIQPLDVFQPGFQLSFAAVAGIVLLYGRFTTLFKSHFRKLREKGFGWLNGVLSLFFVSLAAQLATLPLTVYYFGRLPLISLFANLFVVPMIALVVAVGLVAVMAAIFNFSLGAIFSNTVWGLLTLLIALVKGAASLPFAYVEMARPSSWIIVFYLLMLLLFLLWRQQSYRKVVIVAIFVFANLFVWTHLAPSGKELKITFFDVGQGDSALLQFANGKTMLIDAGDRSEYVDYGERVIVPYLRRHGIRQIDCLLLTHAHADHIGGAPSIIENIHVNRVIESEYQYESEFGHVIDSLATAYDIPKKLVAAGDTLLIDPDVLLIILHPAPIHNRHDFENSADLNNSSIVVKCIYRGCSALFAGDAEIPSETTVLSFGNLLQSDILKIGHHGSRTSSSQEFRRLVAPQFGIVSVAKFNRFGLPSDSLLQEFVNDGTQILKTSNEGAVQFSFSKEGIKRF